MVSVTIAAERATLTAQALATMGVDPTWDRCVTALLAAEVRAWAQEEYGEIAERRNELDTERLTLEAKHGKGLLYNHSATGSALSRIAVAEAACDEDMSNGFYAPLWQAQRDLAMTPAPTLGAALYKASMISLHDVWNDPGMDGHCIEIIDQDLAKFVNSEGEGHHGIA